MKCFSKKKTAFFNKLNPCPINGFNLSKSIEMRRNESVFPTHWQIEISEDLK